MVRAAQPHPFAVQHRTFATIPTDSTHTVALRYANPIKFVTAHESKSAALALRHGANIKLCVNDAGLSPQFFGQTVVRLGQSRRGPGLQPQPTRSRRQRPGIIHRVLVPLPDGRQPRNIEIIASLRMVNGKNTPNVWFLPLVHRMTVVAEYRPVIGTPRDGHEIRDAAKETTRF